MAVVSQDQENNQQGPTGGPLQISGTSAPSSSGKGSVAATSAGGSAPVSNIQANPNQNAGYTDVGAYLNANQAGSQQLGNQVAQNLTNTYNTTTGDINNSSQNFQTQANAGYTPENTQLINQVANDPTSAAANSNLTSGFQSQLNDTYTGPTQWNDTTGANGQTIGGYGTLQGEVNQANQEAALPTTAGGNNVLAQQVEGANATAGVNSLDAMLLGAPGAASTVQAAATPYAGLNDYLNAQNTANLNTVTNDQNAAAQASQDALNAFTGANGTLTGLNTSINNTAAQDLSQAQAEQAALKTDLGNVYGGVAQNNTPTNIGTYGGGTTPWYNSQNYAVNSGALSPQDLQALGMTQDQWNQLTGALQQAGTSTYETGHNFGAASPTSQLDLSQYLSQIPATSGNINAANTATADQYAETQAINQLLGSKAPTQNEALNPALASLAGTYNPSAINQFNFGNALTGANTLSQQEIQAAQQEAATLTGQADQAHAASQQGGGFLSSGLSGFLGAAINPGAWIPNLENAVQNKPVSGTNYNYIPKGKI